MKTILVAVTAALVLVGCSAPTPTPAPSASASASLAPAAQSAITALNQVDPALVDNQERALRRAKNVCDSVARYEGDQTKITGYVSQEFSVDAGKAGQILTAIRGSGYCA